MHDITIPGVDIIIKHIPEGKLAIHNYNGKELQPPEFNIACENLEGAYKYLYHKVADVLSSDYNIDTITIGIRGKTYDTAFSKMVEKTTGDTVYHTGIFSISGVNSKAINKGFSDNDLKLARDALVRMKGRERENVEGWAVKLGADLARAGEN